MRPLQRKIIFIGASAGGLPAIEKILGNLSENMKLPIVVVQHLPPRSGLKISSIVQHYTSRRVYEVEDKMPVEPEKVYLAPPDYHLLVENDHTLALNRDEAVNFSRPSIDVLFESAARLGPQAVAVLLTGASSDGALGIKLIKDHGGMTLVQDPIDANVPMMPEQALKIMTPDQVLSIADLIPYLNETFRDSTR